MHRGTARALLAAAALGAAALAAGCTRFGGRGSSATKPEGAAAAPVQVAAAELAQMEETVSVTGTIRAQREADIGAQISARVVEVRVREGDAVRQGQVLLSLDRAQLESQAQQARAGVEGARARYDAAGKRLQIVEQGARQEEKAIAGSHLEQAEAALRTAEADLTRLRGLFEQGAVSRQQLDAAQMAYDTARTTRDSARESLALTQKGARPEEIDASRREVDAAAAGLHQAQAALANAEDTLTYTVIRSPLTGVVYARNIDPGEIASPMTALPLLQVADLSSLYYEATVSEGKANQVKAGQRAEVIVQVDGERAITGRVERLVPVADPGRRDFLLRISIPSAALGTGSHASVVSKPGVFARGAIVVAEHPEAVVIPKDALVEREGKTIVFVVRSGKAQARQVSVGLTDPTRAEILSGLTPGESVVVVGAGALQDGQAVQLREGGGQ